MSNQRNTNANRQLTKRLTFWGRKWNQAKQDAQLECEQRADLFGDPNATLSHDSQRPDGDQQKTSRQQAIENQITGIVQANKSSNNQRLHQWADYLNVSLEQNEQPEDAQQARWTQKCSLM